MSASFERLEESVLQAVTREIEELIKLEYLTDAIEKLFDFIRDFTAKSSQHRVLMRDALQLSARHARYQKARRHRLPEPEPSQAIVDEIIQQLHAAANVARLPVPPEEAPKVVEAVAKSVTQRIAQPGAKGYSAIDLKRLFIHESQRTHDPDAQVVARAAGIEHSYSRSGFKLGPVSFELRNGEITGVVGMNASGKTTLLSCLLGDLRPARGTVEYPALRRARMDWYAIKGKLGYVAQLPERWSGRLRNNLNFTASAYGLTGKVNEELVEWYVHRYGLKAFENASWDEISGGYKIRFELVRALLTRPRLLVLDEPLAYLDIVTQQIFLHDLRSIASSMEHPIPIVVTSQHLHEIEAIADRMVILDDGRCLYSGPIGAMPTSREYVIFEVGIEATRAEILGRLRPAGLVDLEKTTLGWILIFNRPQQAGQIQRALLGSFGASLDYFRDISNSTRSLFRNHRDDLDHGEGEAAKDWQAG